MRDAQTGRSYRGPMTDIPQDQDPAETDPDPAAPPAEEPDAEPIGEPEQTDNRPRPEDGDQDVDQSPEPAS